MTNVLVVAHLELLGRLGHVAGHPGDHSVGLVLEHDHLTQRLVGGLELADVVLLLGGGLLHLPLSGREPTLQLLELLVGDQDEVLQLLVLLLQLDQPPPLAALLRVHLLQLHRQIRDRDLLRLVLLLQQLDLLVRRQQAALHPSDQAHRLLQLLLRKLQLLLLLLVLLEQDHVNRYQLVHPLHHLIVTPVNQLYYPVQALLKCLLDYLPLLTNQRFEDLRLLLWFMVDVFRLVIEAIVVNLRTLFTCCLAFIGADDHRQLALE